MVRDRALQQLSGFFLTYFRSREGNMRVLLRWWAWIKGRFDPVERRKRLEKRKIKEMADFLENNRKVDSGGDH